MAAPVPVPPPLGDGFDFRREQGAYSEIYRNGDPDNTLGAKIVARQAAFPLITRPAIVHFQPHVGPNPTLFGVNPLVRATRAYTRRRLHGNDARTANRILRQRTTKGQTDYGLTYRRVLGYGRQALTILFELAGAVPADCAVKTYMSTEYELELVEEKVRLMVCQVCVCEVRNTNQGLTRVA